MLRAQSGFYRVETPRGILVAVMRGKLKKERQSSGLVALGDLVELEVLERPEGDAGNVEAVITARLPRAAALCRRAPGPKGAWSQDVIVANIDQIVPVFSAHQPEPELRLLDRFLALAEMDGIQSVIVINKTDLGVGEGLEAALAEYARIGYPVVRTSTENGEGIAELHRHLIGRLSAVVGPSGVGKSSLLNALEPGLGLKVGDISSALNKGKHTTRVGELLPLSGGGLVADTPGVREMGVWALDLGELEFAFVEFRPYVNACKYPDCSHDHEPGCAVRRAVEAKEISIARYESYVALLGEEED